MLQSMGLQRIGYDLRTRTTTTKRKIYNCKCLHLKRFHLKIQEKEEQTKAKTDKRKEIIKIREEMSETQNKRTMEKINSN